ncbi:hypothetical protein [Paraburkholderia tagetis]|uniref:Uncharacterized protein n=1 Tax=Paraburkholderia tagetis TaxID=2913261 RepID=A0A9X1RPH3_9BURK|nr:hypothetical protein [Paraburkholderia tagetis]MCG5075946.1 hypothetical protein [Paraburkholderia tagetis]
MKRKKFLVIFIFFVSLLVLVADLYIGYYYSYIDHEEHEVYFFKRFPTLRREFINPFSNEGDNPSVNELSTNVRKELFDFCKYAYGVTLNDTKSLESCRGQIIREIQ